MNAETLLTFEAAAIAAARENNMKFKKSNKLHVTIDKWNHDDQINYRLCYYTTIGNAGGDGKSIEIAIYNALCEFDEFKNKLEQVDNTPEESI